MKGKNLTKILMSILLVLVSIAVIVIAFVGIYVPKSNKLKNIIPDFKLGTEASGIIEYRLVPDNTETDQEVWVDSKGNIRGFVEDGSEHTHEDESVEVTSDLEESDTSKTDTGFDEEVRTIRKNELSSLTPENFEKSKKLIETRLENAGATEYAIRLDERTGNMVVELSQNDDVSYLYQVALSAYGDFDIIDYQTGVVLLDRSHLVNAGVATNLNQETNKYDIYLQLAFDEKGREIIEEMAKQYVQYTDSEGNEQTDRISIRVDGAPIMTTYFGPEGYDQAVLNIPISSDVEAKDLNTYAKSVNDVAYLLRHEAMPVKYVQDGGALFIESTVASDLMNKVFWSIVTCLVVIILALVVRYKARGFLAGIMNACLIGLVILVLKFTNVVISISSIVALYAVIFLNLIFIIRYLERLKDGVQGAYLETMKKYYSIIFPIIVVAFVYTFFVSTTVTGLGSVLFWGLLLQIIYNTIVAKYVLEGK